MKIKYLFIVLPLIAQLSGCYKDKGNYDYRDINELDVLGMDDHYERDLDDSLKIVPSFEGTLYSDTSMFTYKWTIDGRTVSEELELEMLINLVPGLRKGKFTITDKKTEVVTYKNFDLNVSSVTAGDLYMILSKSKGAAELSYLRLDKEGSDFTVNFFEERFGQPLGTNPQQLDVIYMEYNVNGALSSIIYPFGRNYGGVMARVDNRIKLLDKNSLEPDTVAVALSGESYLGGVVYPVPSTDGYSSQYMTNHISMWRDISNGTHQTGFMFYEISDGKAYGFNVSSNYMANASRWAAVEVPYANGSLAPFCFFEQASNDPDDRENIATQYGFILGNLIVYDVVNSRFASMSYNRISEIPIDQLPAFTGFRLMYGSHTNEAATFYAILRNGAISKMAVMRKSGNSYSLIKEVDVSAVVNENSKFYTMGRNDYIFIVTDDKIYSYNRLDAEAGIAPSTAPVITLSECGYDNTARITAMTVSRSELTMLLGVSRYGADDPEAMAEEAKGDLVQLKMNAAAVTLTYDKKYEGVAGIPVDVKIKYQTHIREGRAFSRGGTGEIIDEF